MKTSDLENILDPDEVASSRSALFALFSLTSQYDIAWTNFFENFAYVNFVLCFWCLKG